VVDPTPAKALELGNALSSTPPQPGPIRFLSLFPSIFLPMLMGMIGETIVATALPVIVASLGGVELIAWVVVAYLISLAITAPVYGRLGDAFGRRRMMVVALVISLVGSVVCALSTSIEMLIAARALQGVGGGGLVSLSFALIGQSVPPRDRVRIHGYLVAIGLSASAMGPLVGALLTDSFGWPAVFLVNVPIGLIAIALVFRLPPRLIPFEPFRFDLPGLLLFASFVWSLLVLVQKIGDPANLRLAMLASLMAIAVISLGLLIAREKRATDPLFPPALMSNPTIWRCNAMAMCHGAYQVSVLTFTPVYLRVVRDQSITEIGLMLLPITFGIGIGTFATGQIVSRTGNAAIFPTVGMAIAAAMVGFAGLQADAMPTLLFAAYFGILALTFGTVMGVVQATVQAESPPTLLGTATAAISLSRALGAAIGTAVTAATLFAVLAASGVQISTELQAVLQGSGNGLAVLGGAEEHKIRADVAFAFHGVFFVIASYAAICSFLAGSLPRRTL